LRERAAGVTLLATSVAYAAADGLLGLTFNATPLVIGVGAVVAGLLGRQGGLIGAPRRVSARC